MIPETGGGVGIRRPRRWAARHQRRARPPLNRLQAKPTKWNPLRACDDSFNAAEAMRALRGLSILRTACR
jgi:hypothetical protein